MKLLPGLTVSALVMSIAALSCSGGERSPDRDPVQGQFVIHVAEGAWLGA